MNFICIYSNDSESFRVVSKPKISLQYRMPGTTKVSNNFSSKSQGLFSPIDFKS